MACGCTVDAELGAGPACPACGHRDHGGAGCLARPVVVGVDLALREDATLAMTIVKTEANDEVYRVIGPTWTVERGADRFIEVLRSKGWRFTHA